MRHKFNIYINTKLSAVSVRMQFPFSSLTKYLQIQLSFLHAISRYTDYAINFIIDPKLLTKSLTSKLGKIETINYQL